MSFFKIDQWRRAVVSTAPIPQTEGICVTLLLDASPTANPQSDESAFACGYLYSSDGETDLLVVKGVESGKWKGGLLCDKTLDLIERYSPALFRYENCVAQGMDFFFDLLQIKAAQRSITLPAWIDAFKPLNKKRAKECRIEKLQTFFDREPAGISFEYGTYLGKLFEQVETWEPGSDKKGRENGCLDALAMLARF